MKIRHLFGSFFRLLAHGWHFVRDLMNRTESSRTIIVVDDDHTTQSRLYKIQPAHVRISLGMFVFLHLAIVYALLAFTPIRALMPDRPTPDERRAAALTEMRLSALEDSLAVLEEYTAQLRELFTGEPEPELPESGGSEAPGSGIGPQFADSVSENWPDHEQPALRVSQMPAASESPVRMVPDSRQYLSSLEFPTLPPVSGFLSRGFDARAGHFGIDIATSLGTPVRAIGDGYVVFADWSQTGGYEIAVQHADGFVSVYKHNQRLLKRVADRVRQREAIATSGDSGEYSSGPHLHLEIWNNGLAQDPSLYLLDL